MATEKSKLNKVVDGQTYRITFFYSKGSDYGACRERGYYASCDPIETKNYGNVIMETYRGGTGYTVFVQPCGRNTEKQFQEVKKVMTPEFINNMIQKVRKAA